MTYQLRRGAVMPSERRHRTASRRRTKHIYTVGSSERAGWSSQHHGAPIYIMTRVHATADCERARRRESQARAATASSSAELALNVHDRASVASMLYGGTRARQHVGRVYNGRRRRRLRRAHAESVRRPTSRDAPKAKGRVTRPSTVSRAPARSLSSCTTASGLPSRRNNIMRGQSSKP